MLRTLLVATIVVAFALGSAFADNERWSVAADGAIALPEHDAPRDAYVGLRGSLAFSITPMFGIAASLRVLAEGPGEVDSVYWEINAGPSGRIHVGGAWFVLAHVDVLNGGVTTGAGGMAQTVSGLGYGLRAGIGWEPRSRVTVRAMLVRTQLWFDGGDVAWRSFELGVAYAW